MRRPGLAAIAAICTAGLATPREAGPSPCRDALVAGDFARAKVSCAEAHARSHDDRDLARLGHAHFVLGERAEAETVGARLLAGPRAGDGHRLLGQVRRQERRCEDARLHASLAYLLHATLGDTARLAIDAVSLSQLAWYLGDFEAARVAGERAVALAGGARGVEVMALLALADALRRLGDLDAAADALDRAVARAATPCDRAWSQLERAMLHAERGEATQALDVLDRAAAADRTCGAPAIAPAIALNRARLRAASDPAAAEGILDDLVATAGASVEIFFLRGLVAAHRGRWAAAAQGLAAAARREPPDADWPWEILQAQAEVAARGGGALGAVRAELFYRRSIAHVQALRAGARGRSAFVIASHRAPYDGLIALLARQGRWRDALAVVLELDAGDMLRATAAASRDRASPLAACAPPSAAASASAGSPVEAATSPVEVATPSVEAVIAAWRGRDLVIVVAPAGPLVAGEDEPVVRLRIADGEVTGMRVGSAAQARIDADVLLGAPGDARAGRALGALIVPADARTDTLDVLAIDQLGRAPLAALRDAEGAPIVARRPLARVLSLRPRIAPASDAAAPPVAPARALVIADPRGDLRHARIEGRLVAARIGAGARLVGTGAPAATSAILEEARAAEVLHVAAHVVGHGETRALALADGDVAADQLVARGIAPRLAVLASCGSAAARDREGWGSIAAALLAAGTETVIATDRSVPDAASFALVAAFYARPDWQADPARALAAVQGALTGEAASVAAALVVLRAPPRASGEHASGEVR